MRYQVGKNYVFTSMVFAEVNRGLWSLFKPWEDKISEMNVFELKCVEHHKVSDGYSEDKQHDGFIFELVHTNTNLPVGTRFDNQYPHASYGQLSTDADYELLPSFEGIPEGTSLHEALISFFMESRPLADMGFTMEKIDRGIKHPSFQTPEMENKKQKLQDWFNYLALFMKEVFDTELVFKPVFRKNQETGAYDVPTTLTRMKFDRKSETTVVEKLHDPDTLASIINKCLANN